MHQRAVVALIRASGERIANLRDGRLVELWRRYSLVTHQCVWFSGDAAEVKLFIAWAGGQPGVFAELLLARGNAAPPAPVIRIRATKHTMRFDEANETEPAHHAPEQAQRRVTVRFSSGRPHNEPKNP